MNRVVSVLENLDFTKICRACCSPGDVMVSIFKVHMSRKIMEMAAVQVWESDGLPTKICKDCIVKLDISHQFKKQCEKSDLTLRQHKALMETSKAEALKEIKTELLELTPVNAARLLEQLECKTELLSQKNSSNDIHNQVSLNLDNITVAKMDHSYASCSPDAENLVHDENELTDFSNALPSPTSPDDILCFSIENEEEDSGDDPKPDLLIPEGMWQCKLCFKLYDSKRKLKRHVYYVHQKPQPEQIDCMICKKVFDSARKLKRHAYVHSGMKPHKCEVCKKQFSHRSNLKAHMKLHSDERPYVCGVCEKSCKRAKDLEMHTRTHTGHKPHACDTCGRAFSSSSNLIAHIRTHTGEKPYICSVCQKSFCQSNELTKHRRVHVKERHICQICGKNFSGAAALIVHVMNHGKEKSISHTCSICYKNFSSSALLSTHLEKHEMGQLDF